MSADEEAEARSIVVYLSRHDLASANASPRFPRKDQGTPGAAVGAPQHVIQTSSPATRTPVQLVLEHELDPVDFRPLLLLPL